MRGWVKVRSYTEPADNILRYPIWQVGREPTWLSCKVAEARWQNSVLLVQLAGIDDRDRAAQLVGAEIAVPRAALPALGADEFYWADIIGLQVFTVAGVDLGVVESLLETGSNDVLVVMGERRRLIPFIRGEVIVDVDRDQGFMRVHWDPAFV